MFLENLLGSKAKVKLLRVLAESRTAFTLQDLKNETELSIGIIHQSLQDLLNEGIILKIKGKRKERLFKFDTDSSFAHPIFELFRLEKTSQRKESVFLHTWNVLESAVSKLKEKSSLILLFGSQARGNATLRSDIDILVIPTNSLAEITVALNGVKSKNIINPLIISLPAFQEEIKKNTLFYQNIKADAFILYFDSKIKEALRPFFEDIGYKNGSRI
jgi:predicted nucleotidyltransferase